VVPGAGNTFLGGRYALWRQTLLCFSRGEFSWEGKERGSRVLALGAGRAGEGNGETGEKIRVLLEGRGRGKVLWAVEHLRPLSCAYKEGVE